MSGRVAVIAMARQVAEAIYAFAPTNKDDLALQQGDRVEVRLYGRVAVICMGGWQ